MCKFLATQRKKVYYKKYVSPEKDLTKPYEMIDMVTTPDGSLVAMVHCNNCTSDLNAWVNLFKEYQQLLGVPVDMNEVFGKLYNHALEGDADCGADASHACCRRI